MMLEIAGHDERPVPNAFFRHDGDTAHLGVVLPGLRYRVTMPGLYYPTLHLMSLGADVLAVDYRYDENPDLGSLSDAEQIAWWAADARAAVDAGLSQREYDRVTVVGKSLGTVAMAPLLADDERLAHADAIWLTPTLKLPGFVDQMKACPQRGLVIIGTADPYHDVETLTELGESGMRIVEVPHADHGLQREGDAVASVAAMLAVMTAIRQFLADR